MKRLVGCLIVILAVMPLILLQGQGEARTYYESLNLDTPEDAVQTFLDAYQQQDFATVYLILSLESQQEWRRRFAVFDFDRLFKDGSLILDLLPPSDEWEHQDGWYIFDLLMLQAAENNQLLLELEGDIEILDTIPSKTPDDEEAIDVLVGLESSEDNLIFRTTQSPSRRWRVLQVILPDGDESLIPWSIPQE